MVLPLVLPIWSEFLYLWGIQALFIFGQPLGQPGQLLAFHRTAATRADYPFTNARQPLHRQRFAAVANVTNAPV